MKYYHVNQGVHSEEPMLSVMAHCPIDAASKYFAYLIVCNSQAIAFAADCVVKVNGDVSFSEWEDILFQGCYVENRESGEYWSVSTSEPGSDRHSRLAMRMIGPGEAKAEPKTKRK